MITKNMLMEKVWRVVNRFTAFLHDLREQLEKMSRRKR